jgi:hypothetical protein
MNADAETPSPDVCVIAYTYDSNNRLITTSERITITTSERITSVGVTTYNDPAQSPAERLKLAHDTQKRLFILAAPGGKT